MTDIFDFKPVLEGPRVIVRPIQDDDWEDMMAAAANPKVWELHPVTDRYKEPVFRTFSMMRSLAAARSHLLMARPAE